jgi:uncharacterized membrane protein YhaH (DUF805 family)
MYLANVKELLITKGRTNRTEFLAYAFLYSLTFYIMVIPFLNAPYSIYLTASYIASFIYLIFFGALLIRRVHDYDEKAWYALLILIPIINLYVMFAPGNPMPNRFGYQPQRASITVSVVAISSIVLPLVFLALIAVVPEFREYVQGLFNEL